MRAKREHELMVIKLHNKRFVIILASCRENQTSQLTTMHAVVLRACFWVNQVFDIKDGSF